MYQTSNNFNQLNSTLTTTINTHENYLFIDYNSLNWLNHITSFCSCQYFLKSTSSNSLIYSKFLYCPCLSNYSEFDSTGIIRLKILHYLSRIQSALNSSSLQELNLSDIM